MNHLKLFGKDSGIFVYGGNIFSKITHGTKQFFRHCKFAKQRAQEGFASNDLWDMDYWLMELLEQSLTKFVAIKNKGVPSSLFEEQLKTIYEKHKDEFVHSYDEFFCYSSSLTPTEIYYYNEAEAAATSAWEGIIRLMIKHFHDANPHNEKEVMEEYGFETNSDGYNKYYEFKRMQRANGFDLLDKYLDALWW